MVSEVPAMLLLLLLSPSRIPGAGTKGFGDVINDIMPLSVLVFSAASLLSPKPSAIWKQTEVMMHVRGRDACAEAAILLWSSNPSVLFSQLSFRALST